MDLGLVRIVEDIEQGRDGSLRQDVDQIKTILDEFRRQIFPHSLLENA